MFRTHLFHTILEATKDWIEVYQFRESPFSPSPRENSYEPGPSPPPTAVNPQRHLAGDLRNALGCGLPGAEAATRHLNASRIFRLSSHVPSILYYVLFPSFQQGDPLGIPQTEWLCWQSFYDTKTSSSQKGPTTLGPLTLFWQVSAKEFSILWMERLSHQLLNIISRGRAQKPSCATPIFSRCLSI